MSDYVAQTQQQLAAKLAISRHTGLSYLANRRNIEAPWYAEMLHRINTVLSGVPCTIIAPQLPVNLMVELDAGGDVEMAGEGDDGDDAAVQDPDASMETIGIPVNEEKVPDFCIIAGDCRPDDADDGRLKAYFLGHKIKKSRVVAIVECKRRPKRRQPAQEFEPKLLDHLATGETQAEDQGALLLDADRSVKEVYLIASSGHYWRLTLLTRDNVPREAGGPNATYVDAPRKLRWSKIYEMGTPGSDRKLASLRKNIKAMQEALCRE
ncbi:uncharacterized protein PHACADRAFT_197447 [Phanerochaete carnosa HHB-10118-sp]|uniref:Uncharacterized protein n=1 Tax=Phanerochaete carnosa (strain HHB-10118-sp) TaxID=650164 RepID=K5WRK7_PHACS|nr:uncharacterized protein PHACADRAFT_197447 [Phanerochaete carnosa HHB-10118-sp]EKM53017.1 hypothetical protein PHACADRAFT_197447 [Phanerochaete carnosa HHB-10118-sp]